MHSNTERLGWLYGWGVTPSHHAGPVAVPGQMDSAADQLLVASRALLAVVARSVAPALELVTLPQFRVLVVLSAAGVPLRTGALADAIGVHRSTFSRSADRLVAGGWVQRVDNPDSRREVLIELTARGADLVALVSQRRREEIVAILETMTADDRALAARGLAAFAQASGEPHPSDLAALGM